ncbi:MAG: hypothetical protein Q8R48_08370, partial [Candidatus Omnitrophota bacterium]|nr:hypothetical protein [Candidatus Omnitrophota bacterium]
YDDAGKKLQASGGWISYDPNGAVIDSGRYSTTYAYDENGNLLQRDTRQYDANNRMAHRLLESFATDEAGTNYRLFSGDMTFTYNPDGTLQSTDIVYNSYDSSGNITQTSRETIIEAPPLGTGIGEVPIPLVQSEPPLVGDNQSQTFEGTLEKIEVSLYMQGEYMLKDADGNLVCLVSDPEKKLSEELIGKWLKITGPAEKAVEGNTLIITSVEAYDVPVSIPEMPQDPIILDEEAVQRMAVEQIAATQGQTTDGYVFTGQMSEQSSTLELLQK